MVKLLSTFILALIPFFFNSSYNLIIDLLNYLIQTIGPAATNIISLFPANPCGSLVASCSDVAPLFDSADPGILALVLQCLAWLTPINFLVDLVGCSMLTVMIYFTMAPVARWLKLIT